MDSDDNWPSPQNMREFTYSKRRHFELFQDLPFRSFSDPDPADCDLKVYQDWVTYCFIGHNIRPGSRILEVGGGDSRVLKFFARDYECWNADKFEGLGHGPRALPDAGYRIVEDYIGAFNPELPADYFDLVFSISALEHTPEDAATREAIAGDIDRVLKPGAPSFHCFDISLRSGRAHWISGLIPYLHSARPVVNPPATPDEILGDPDTYFMAQRAYDRSWSELVGETYAEFGLPLSYNLLWLRGEVVTRST